MIMCLKYVLNWLNNELRLGRDFNTKLLNSISLSFFMLLLSVCCINIVLFKVSLLFKVIVYMGVTDCYISDKIKGHHFC